MQTHAERRLCAALMLMLLLSGCIRPVYYDTPTPPVPTAIQIPAFDAEPPAPPASIYLEPAAVDLAAGEIATVHVRIDGAHQLNRIELELSFDPTGVQVEDAVPSLPGVQVAPGEIPQPIDVVRNEVTVGADGRIFYTVAQQPGSGADGSGVAVSILLLGLAEGSTSLQFERVAATDAAGHPLDLIPLSGAQVTVRGAPVIPSPTPPPVAVETPTGLRGIYTVVQPGENLYRLGLRFGVSAQAIADASGLSDVDRVQAGALVRIPVTPSEGTAAYLVQAGDTLYSIARRLNLTVDRIVALNSISANHVLEPGQMLMIEE